MSAYEALAASYDALTYDVPYDKILRFWETLLRRFRVRPGSVLDLACGTGSLSVLLARSGYHVIGADRSEQMLCQAEQKAQQLPENRPFFICQPMQRLRLPEPVDAVICCLDSINYLTDPADCRRTFARVFDALKPGGLFVFDVDTPYKLRSLNGQVFLDEREGADCVWRAEYRERARRLYYGMDLFTQQGKLWARSFEEHVEYAYTMEELTQYLNEAGFSDVRLFADRKLRSPEPTELRVYFAAKKDEKT